MPSTSLEIRHDLAAWLAIGGGAICLLLPAVVNGFPFVFADSADYLVFSPHIYRSPFYGLFLYLCHWNRFIWAPIVAQSLMVSHLIWLFCAFFAPARLYGAFLSSVLILLAISSLPYFSGFLMADFFTPVVVLTIFALVYFKERLLPLMKVYLMLLAALAMAAHVSHIVLAVAVLCATALLRQLGRPPSGREVARAVGLPLVALGLATSAVLLNNAVIHGVFNLSPAGKVFLMANMIEHGPARTYLEKACPAAGYKLCGIVDRLPATANELLWSTNLVPGSGAFAAIFTELSQEAGEIVGNTVASQPLDVARMLLVTTVRALMAHQPGAELHPLVNDEAMSQVLGRRFSARTLQAYRNSLQARNLVPRHFLRGIDRIVFPLCIVGLLLSTFWTWRRGTVTIAPFAASVAFAYLANAAMCGFSSGVWDRYQARLSWLIVFALVLTCAVQLNAARPGLSLPSSPQRGGRIADD